MERFIETLMALVMQYEEEIQPGPDPSASGVLKFLMEDRGLRSYRDIGLLARPQPLN